MTSDQETHAYTDILVVGGGVMATALLGQFAQLTLEMRSELSNLSPRILRALAALSRELFVRLYLIDLEALFQIDTDIDLTTLREISLISDSDLTQLNTLIIEDINKFQKFFQSNPSLISELLHLREKQALKKIGHLAPILLYQWAELPKNVKSALLDPGMKLKITVVEKKQHVGCGFPFSENETVNDHLVNIVSGCISLAGTEILDPIQSDFSTWLSQLSSYERMEYGVDEFIKFQKHTYGSLLYKITGDDHNVLNPNIAFPRRIVGYYLENRYKEFAKQATLNGFDITSMLNSEAISYSNDGVKSFVKVKDLQTNEERWFVTSALCLFTGHWFIPDDKNLSFVYNSPWPPKKFESIPSNSSIGILGASLSGIDTALSVASVNGHFKIEESSDYPVKYYPKDPNLKINLLSRSGREPDVMGKVTNDVFCHRYFTQDNLKTKIETENDHLFIDLDVAMRLLVQDMILSEIEAISDNRMLGYSITELVESWSSCELEVLLEQLDHSWPVINSLENFISSLEDSRDAQSPENRLMQGLKTALESVQHDRCISYQNVLYQSYQTFDFLFRYLSAEDRLFYDRMKSILLTLIGAFPIQNAEKILAMMNAGVLDIITLGKEYSLSIDSQSSGDNKRIIVRDTHKNIYEFDVLIKALPQNNNMSEHKSSLIHDLIEQNLLQQVVVPFRDQSQARIMYETNDSVNIPYIKKDRNNIFVLPRKGMLIDHKNHRVIPSSVFANSPIIYGMNPDGASSSIAFPTDYSVLTNAAEAIVADICFSFEDIQYTTSSQLDSYLRMTGNMCEGNFITDYFYQVSGDTIQHHEKMIAI